VTQFEVPGSIATEPALNVMPESGIQGLDEWIPACAGMTSKTSFYSK
jgi:hypothetical protein